MTARTHNLRHVGNRSDYDNCLLCAFIQIDRKSFFDIDT
jgi:hypothetical protein